MSKAEPRGRRLRYPLSYPFLKTVVGQVSDASAKELLETVGDGKRESATMPNRTPKPPTPRCTSAVLCRQVVFDKTTMMPSLVNVFFSFKIQAEPGQSPPFALLVQLTDGRGDHDRGVSGAVVTAMGRRIPDEACGEGAGWEQEEEMSGRRFEQERPAANCSVDLAATTRLSSDAAPPFPQ